MSNLIRMDRYRMLRQRAVVICLLLAFGFSLVQTPLEVLVNRLFQSLLELPPSEPEALSSILGNPFPSVNAMLLFLAVCAFYYADVEQGFIKNIAGQVPRRGWAVLSKYLASCLLTLIFALAGIGANLMGTLPFKGVTVDGEVAGSLLVLLQKLLLAQSICAILLLCVSTLGVKSLGTTLAVLFGTGLTGLIYFGISSGVNRILKTNVDIGDYMPDQLLNASKPELGVSLLAAGITGAVFLTLAIRIFDHRDVK